MLTRFALSVIGLIIIVAAVCFAIANREPVMLGFWPVTQELTLPLFVPAFAFGIIGFLAGGLVAWLSGARWRRLARQRGRHVQELERRIGALENAVRARAQEERAGLPPAATAGPPALRQVGGRG